FYRNSMARNSLARKSDRIIRLQNTYMMEPEKSKTLPLLLMRKILKNCIESICQEINTDNVISFVKLLLKNINIKMKVYLPNRYKMINSISIVDKSIQSDCCNFYGFIWNDAVDTFINHTISLKKYIIYTTIFFLYVD
ncbi:hypothetical protein A3Q56_07929, partial [Intoshia linei]